MISDDILDLLGPLNPMHDTHCQTMEIYWFHRLIDWCKIYDRMIEEKSIIDYEITSEAEPFLGMFDVYFKPIPVVKHIKLTYSTTPSVDIERMVKKFKDSL